MQWRDNLPWSINILTSFLARAFGFCCTGLCCFLFSRAVFAGAVVLTESLTVCSAVSSPIMIVMRNLTELRKRERKVLFRAVRYLDGVLSGMSIDVGMMSEYPGRTELKIAGANQPWPAPPMGHALPATSMDSIDTSPSRRVNTERWSMRRNRQNGQVNIALMAM